MPLFKPFDLLRLNAWITILRDLSAVLFIPCSCIYAAFLVYILWRGGWPDETAPQRIQYLGIALIGLLVLVALGVLWLQRRDIPNIKITAPGGFQTEITERDNDAERSKKAEGDGNA